MLEADDRARNRCLRTDLHRAFRDILGQVTDSLEVAGDADGDDELAQVDRHRLAARDRQDGQLLDFALQRVEA